MSYVFEPEARVSIPVAGSDAQFPVRRVYCVGRNYAAHAREMGFDPDREPPFFFCKPDNSIVVVPPGELVDIAYPQQTQDYQHEIELVVAIGPATGPVTGPVNSPASGPGSRSGRDIPVDQALEHVFGYAVGLDMTRRDLQLALRDKGRPWELGKAFDQSAPIAPLYPASRIGHPKDGAVWVQVDGVDRQRSDIAKLIWSVPEVISHLSRYFELKPGDLIFSGTPEGVGRVQRGQTMRGGIDGLGELTVRVV